MIFYFEILIRGHVQGVGFRPFVYQLAQKRGLSGWVRNGTGGVEIALIASEENLESFVDEIQKNKPAMASLQEVKIEKRAEASFLESDLVYKLNFELKAPMDSSVILAAKSQAHFGLNAQVDPHSMIQSKSFFESHVKDHIEFQRFQPKVFRILKSSEGPNEKGDLPPDLATCFECQKEIFNPAHRRYLYPFTNCTHCGPRFSITKGLPYDRPMTTMAPFIQCEDCLSEYEDPSNRRFHAQPNACPRCGPQVSLWTNQTESVAHGQVAINRLIDELRNGAIVAVKGIGGYQLVVDASNEKALMALRERKHRPHKPFAVMMRSIQMAKAYCHINSEEEKDLSSVEAPIVLLRKKKGGANLPALLAPNNGRLGVFLPYSPLHHIILEFFGAPLVVTSGNLSDEPMVYREPEVFERLAPLADFFLVHHREIVHPIDDSVVQWVHHKRIVLRAARGMTPMVFGSKFQGSRVLATGAHIKNTFALQKDERIILSQHLGDMEEELTQSHFKEEVNRYLQFYQHQPTAFVSDLHPRYFTTQWAQEKVQQEGLPLKLIQHHRAHIAAVLIEHELTEPFLGAAWDGTGWGEDGTVWGGEFFFSDKNKYSLYRVGHLRTFRLLGSQSAIEEPWKVALSLLFQLEAEGASEGSSKGPVDSASQWFFKHFPEKTQEDFLILKTAWERGINAPFCSSMGRWMDGVSALLGVVLKNTFEGEAAITLQNRVQDTEVDWKSGRPLFQIKQSNTKNEERNNDEGPSAPWEWDWGPWLKNIIHLLLECPLEGLPQEQRVAAISTELHLGLAEGLFEWAQRLNVSRIVLGGGVFQNQFLLEAILRKAPREGVEIILPHRSPINDGGIALGQIGLAST